MRKEEKQQQAIIQQKTQEAIQRQQTILLMTQNRLRKIKYFFGKNHRGKINFILKNL